jgi:hypothetical protein
VPALRSLAAFVLLLAGLAAGPPAAHACACCTNVGQRYEGVEPIDSGKLDAIDRLRFGPKARLFTGEADAEMIEGISAKSSRYSLQVTREKGRWVFAFRDEGGRTGTLALTLPKSMAVLAVDTRRDSREGGTGPGLYYEWKLSSRAAGSGIFGSGAGKGQRITLVLQGHGNSCTDASSATYWMLAVSGPGARFHLFGELVQP